MGAHTRLLINTVGGGVLLFVFLLLASEGNRISFENRDAPLWASLYPVWYLLSLVAPGVFMGVVSRRRPLLDGAAAGVIGWICVCVDIRIHWSRYNTDPAFSPPFREWLLMAAVYITCIAGLSWVTAFVLKRKRAVNSTVP